jgi:hypothetical protein
MPLGITGDFILRRRSSMPTASAGRTIVGVDARPMICLAPEIWSQASTFV